MAYEDKSAYALCIFSLAVGPNSDPITFSGKTPVCSLLCSFYNNICIWYFFFWNFRSYWLVLSYNLNCKDASFHINWNMEIDNSDFVLLEGERDLGRVNLYLIHTKVIPILFSVSSCLHPYIRTPGVCGRHYNVPNIKHCAKFAYVLLKDSQFLRLIAKKWRILW